MNSPTRAIIDRNALRNNLRVIRSRLAPATRIMAVVKANCYGHETAICLPVVLESGIDLLAVASIEEGVQLREMGITARIVVLRPPFDEQFRSFAPYDLEALISNPQMADQLAQATPLGAVVRVHQFVDTGMGRNGARPEHLLETLRRISQSEALQLQGLASHFATSDERDDPYVGKQLLLFESALRQAFDAGFTFDDIHIANSGGIFNYPGSHFTVVRPGLSLYGYHPTAERQQQSGLQPVMSLRSRIANITRMPAGESISYGRRYTTAGETSIATVPIGYADGLMRRLTNRLSALIDGRRFPVVGTICMDEVMIDIGNAADIQIGADVVLIGSSGSQRISAWELALNAETIPYEICTNVSSRVPRVQDEDLKFKAISNNTQSR